LRSYNTDDDEADAEAAAAAAAVKTLKDRPTHAHWVRTSFGFRKPPQWTAEATAAAVADIAAADPKKVGRDAVALWRKLKPQTGVESAWYHRLKTQCDNLLSSKCY
jgi:hypothetical protein